MLWTVKVFADNLAKILTFAVERSAATKCREEFLGEIAALWQCGLTRADQLLEESAILPSSGFLISGMPFVLQGIGSALQTVLESLCDFQQLEST